MSLGNAQPVLYRRRLSHNSRHFTGGSRTRSGSRASSCRARGASYAADAAPHGQLMCTRARACHLLETGRYDLASHPVHDIAASSSASFLARRRRCSGKRSGSNFH